jgi:hypothetical protein
MGAICDGSTTLDPDIAMTANNLALLLGTEGQWEEAEALAETALRIFRQSLPPGHPKLELWLANLKAIGDRKAVSDAGSALRLLVE